MIRPAEPGDFVRIWPFFRDIVRRGDTYAIDPQIGEDDARALWMERSGRVFVAEDGGEIVGTYTLKPNHGGGGAHICNCGYMVSPAARGRGIATRMCEHSQATARRLGFRAMQFNLVVASNTGAFRLWKKLGYREVGRIPEAFRLPSGEFVDAFVMHKRLDRG